MNVKIDGVTYVPKKEEPQGWEVIVGSIRVSSTARDIGRSTTWPIRLSVPAFKNGRYAGSYCEDDDSPLCPGDSLDIKEARAIAEAILQGCALYEETQKEGKK